MVSDYSINHKHTNSHTILERDLVEVLRNDGDIAHEAWQLIDKVVGTVVAATVASASGQREIAPLRLTRAISLQANCVYAIRLTMQGGKTFCGEGEADSPSSSVSAGGLSSIRLTNGVRVQFQPCLLSENGTSLARGQIPFLLYSVSDVKEEIAQTVADREQVGGGTFLGVIHSSS